MSRTAHRLHFAFVRLMVALLVVGIAAPLLAQSVINPTSARFTASTDHGVTLPGGVPAVDRYEMEFYFLGAAAPFRRCHWANRRQTGPGRFS